MKQTALRYGAELNAFAESGQGEEQEQQHDFGSHRANLEVAAGKFTAHCCRSRAVDLQSLFTLVNEAST
jgi:hypothetical protein